MSHYSIEHSELNTMVIFSIVYGLFAGFTICMGDDNMLGPGKWSIISIERCEEDELFSNKVDIETHRLNRTHVGFSFKLHLEDEVNEAVAMRIDVCKYVDGGCKAFQTVADESIIHFCEKYAKQNVETAFQMADVDGWPVSAGDYAVDDYVFNLEELPDDAVYGEFIAKGYLIKNAVDISCIKAATKFEKCEDED